MEIVDKIDTDDIINLGKSYLKSYSSDENKEKVKLLYKDVKDKINKFTSENIVDKFENRFDVKKAQEITYEVKVIKKNNTIRSGTAIEINKDGKLITAYHYIVSYKDIKIVGSNSMEYNVTVGKVSIDNDLAYLYIDVKDIPFVRLADNIDLGEDIYLLSYDNLLLTGIISQIKDNGILLNIEAKKCTSGGGVFNNKNELVAILLSKDILYKTSFAATTKSFQKITQNYHEKAKLNLDTNNYDYSYCNDKDDLKLWNKYSKSNDLKVQEFHALFIGLCEKVKNKDLTTEMA